MLNGLPSMAAAVVIRRRNPSWDGRTNAINPSCWRHQLRATRLWGCSGAERASQTLMSGMTSPAGMKSWNCLWELDELIDLFIGQVEFASRGWNQRLIEVEPPLRPGWRGLLDGQQAPAAFFERRREDAVIEIAGENAEHLGTLGVPQAADGERTGVAGERKAGVCDHELADLQSGHGGGDANHAESEKPKPEAPSEAGWFLGCAGRSEERRVVK